MFIKQRYFEQSHPDTQKKMMIGNADGYGAMHARGMVHYDTKPENLFYSGSTAKMGDFGFSRRVQPNEIPGVNSHGSFVPVDLKELGKKKAGNPFAVDVFANGISMLTLRVGEKILKIDGCCISLASGRRWFVIDGEALYKNYESRLQNIPEAERKLIKRMLSNDPKQRGSMLDVGAQLREIHNIQTI